MLGRDVLLAVLQSEGVRHIFGNPGTTELPLIDALSGPTGEAFDYVLSLQEATVVGMADGYAQASGRPSFVNLHTTAGLGNAMGNLSNAVSNRTPMVVTAGNADRRHLVADPILAGDLRNLARPQTKAAYEVSQIGDLGVLLRRAFLEASAHPRGPVFVSMPCDVLMETVPPPELAVTVGGPIPPRSVVARGASGDHLDELLGLLVGAAASGNLAIVAGEEVGTGGAVPALTHLAESLGATVWGSPLHSNTVFPVSHPLWAGALPFQADRIRAIFENAGVERVFLAGSQAFMVYPWSPGPPLPAHVELLQLAPDPAAVGRTHPVRFGVVGDMRASLEDPGRLADERMAASGLANEVAASLSVARRARTESMAREDEEALQLYDSVPMHPTAAVHAALRALPDDVTVVDEAITAGALVRRHQRASSPGRYFFCRGGGLGWGMPAACGISLARGGDPVLCVVGDGSTMYSPQALWTAASRRLPVVFLVLHNRQYAILKANLKRSRGADEERFVGLDMAQPAVDFVALAQSMGVDGQRVEKATDVGLAVQTAWQSGRPTVLELPVVVP